LFEKDMKKIRRMGGFAPIGAGSGTIEEKQGYRQVAVGARISA
jgi:hypothetical protein